MAKAGVLAPGSGGPDTNRGGDDEEAAAEGEKEQDGEYHHATTEGNDRAGLIPPSLRPLLPSVASSETVHTAILLPDASPRSPSTATPGRAGGGADDFEAPGLRRADSSDAVGQVLDMYLRRRPSEQAGFAFAATPAATPGWRRM